MFCGNCGTQNNDNASFCTNCGAPLNQQVYTQQYANVQNIPASQKSYKGIITILIIFIVATIIVMAGCIVGLIV